MSIKLDVHTHTVASGHAFSTLQEMVREAANRGLEILGITEHDAHFSLSIADYQYIWPLLEEVGFPEELVLNDKPKMFLNVLKRN